MTTSTILKELGIETILDAERLYKNEVISRLKFKKIRKYLLHRAAHSGKVTAPKPPQEEDVWDEMLRSAAPLPNLFESPF